MNNLLPPMRDQIAKLVHNLHPFDALEAAHIAQTLQWIESGEPLFRTQKPATPPQHLVSYFVLFDRLVQKILLVDHKNAGLWLPAGGHVEPDEDPQITVVREAAEELQIEADFLQPKPLFLTITQTVGRLAQHVDVSLWYVLQCDSNQPLAFDEHEFYRVQWFALNQLPLERCDPHLHRFCAKLQTHYEYPIRSIAL